MIRLKRIYVTVVVLAACVFSGLVFLLRPAHAERKISDGCIRTTKMTQEESQGIRFVLSENACDTFGNSVYSTIYASGPDGRHRVALIKFGPDARSPPPRISIEDNKTIVIEIDSVAELVEQTAAYDSYRVVYRIKNIVYPAPKTK